MIDLELRRIAVIYGASEQHVDEVARRAFEEPMVPVSEIMAHVIESSKSIRLVSAE